MAAMALLQQQIAPASSQALLAACCRAWRTAACSLPPRQQQQASAFHAGSAACAAQPQQQQQHALEEGALPAASSNGRTLLDAGQRESLALLRRFNVAQPLLRGQVILAKVLRTTPRQVLVDPGYYGLNWVSRQELASAAAYDAQGRPIPRTSATIRPGEYIKVRLSAFNTPYGDAQLDAVGVSHEARQKLVWEELAQRMRSAKPVMGRILNPTVKGYAVGVAGYVALLAHSQASPEHTAAIGTLQEFYVYRMDRARRQIELTAYRRGPTHDIYSPSI